MTRKIIHIDMDAFYASVEQRDRPELRGKPLAVGGAPQSRGVVASASYEARRFGVRSAMPSGKAAALCPGLIFVSPEMARYKAVSRQIQAMFREVTDLVEPLSLDEAYLDVTENKLGEKLASRVAVMLRSRIRNELGLTASAGVGPNKFIAKLASDLKKPDALVVIPPERVAALMEKLPVEKFWGVGPATAKKLKAHGLHTANELRACPLAMLEHLVGRWAHSLQRMAYGEDQRLVNNHREPKSRGSETTFGNDLKDLPALRKILSELSEDVASSLQRIGKRGQTVTVKIRYRDFRTITRSRTLLKAFDDQRTISELAQLLMESTEAGRVPVRLLGVSVSSLRGRQDGAQSESDSNSNQLCLFESPPQPESSKL